VNPNYFDPLHDGIVRKWTESEGVTEWLILLGKKQVVVRIYGARDWKFESWDEERTEVIEDVSLLQGIEFDIITSHDAGNRIELGCNVNEDFLDCSGGVLSFTCEAVEISL
jgi:hypothetical protein